MTTRIALIHATRLAMQPIEEAFQQIWPDAERMNLLEDSLSVDRAKSEEITPALTQRFVALARYAKEAGADAILYTCSAFGPAIELARAAVAIPTLKPNEAMYRQALDAGSRIGLVTTFEPASAPMKAELIEMAAACGRVVDLKVICKPEALAALQAGKPDLHDRYVVEAVQELADCDVVMLGQFSMARAQEAAQRGVAVPVLTSADCAVKALRTEIEAKAAKA